MTDTPADPRHGTDSQDGPVGGTIEHLDPHSLEVGDNVREYANLNKPFLDSIAEHGVLTPITAIRRPDGVVEVRNGQRRTMAARKLGLSSVPVYVLPATAADTAAETIDRIVHQIVTNDHKSDLTDAQRARGIQQMIDAGLSVSKVAKKLAVGKDTVTAAQAAAKSSAALQALDGGQISLAQAAALTEFDHDGPASGRSSGQGRRHTAVRPRGVPAALRTGQRTGPGPGHRPLHRAGIHHPRRGAAVGLGPGTRADALPAARR